MPESVCKASQAVFNKTLLEWEKCKHFALRFALFRILRKASFSALLPRAIHLHQPRETH